MVSDSRRLSGGVSREFYARKTTAQVTNWGDERKGGTCSSTPFVFFDIRNIRYQILGNKRSNRPNGLPQNNSSDHRSSTNSRQGRMTMPSTSRRIGSRQTNRRLRNVPSGTQTLQVKNSDLCSKIAVNSGIFNQKCP